MGTARRLSRESGQTAHVDSEGRYAPHDLEVDRTSCTRFLGNQLRGLLSGIGRELGWRGLDACTEEKVISVVM
jgi:hypothetical protein